MKIVFDLDHTIFDTTEFKSDLFALLLRSGASSGNILDTYKEHLEITGGGYNFFLHCKLIEKKEKHFDTKRALVLYEEFTGKNFSKYISEDTRKALHFLKQSGCQLLLLTKGGEETQKTKLRQSGMEDVFEGVYICQGSKLATLETLGLQAGDWFVDDSLEEIVTLQSAHPELQYFLVQSEYSGGVEGDVGNIRFLRTPDAILQFLSPE
ncbi:MAG: HAD family hydrolase [Patescibacteria group bacterium]